MSLLRPWETSLCPQPGQGGTPRAGPLTKASAAVADRQPSGQGTRPHGRRKPGTGWRMLGPESGTPATWSQTRAPALGGPKSKRQHHGCVAGSSVSAFLCGNSSTREKVLRSAPAFMGRWEEEWGSCSLARAPTHGKPPCEFSSPMMASYALLLRNESPPHVAA